MPTVAAKRATFRRLHEKGCFVLPNPWDVGTARYLQHLGFAALASTSAGFAFARGHADNAVPRDVVLAHLAELVAATDVPINADFEGGFADDPAGVAANVRLAAATGVAGISIEDSTGRADSPLYPLDLATERVRAARRALDAAAPDVMLVARAECYFVGRPDLDETVMRLRAYAGAGADCLYAPGLATRDEIATVVAAVAPKPVNVVMLRPIGFTVADLAALGVRRISLGSALARAAWGELDRSAREILDHGSFDGLRRAMSSATLNALFRART